jgi:outer membrane protein OmpA-like peptidoglycan-associated protein
MSMTRAVALLAVVAVGAGGCATKKYVRSEVGEVNRKADSLSSDMEKTQERVRRNETRIDEVNADLQTGKAAANDALSKANDAQQAARGKLIYSVTLSDDQVKFPFDKSKLSDEAKARVDEALAPIVAANKGVYFEIEGHTDSVGPDSYNLKLGEMRAMAVRDYIHDHMGIALSRLEVVSYGETKPVTDNKTREERAENRRVVVKVLE